MVNVRFSNYEQFLDFFRNAPRNIQNILYKAYPDFAARMTKDYMNATTPKQVSGSTPKQIGMAKDTVKGTGKVAEEAVKNTAKTVSTAGKIGSKLAGIAKGGVGIAGKVIAPIQGISNLISPNSDTTDILSGIGMLGAGTAAIFGAPYAAGAAATLGVGDMLKKYAAAPLGEKIGEAIWKHNNPDWVDRTYQAGDLIDPYDPNLNIQDPEKIKAYNERILAQQHKDIDNAIEANVAEQEAWDKMINNNPEAVRQINNDYFGGSYPSNPVSDYGIYPQITQNAQDAQEGGLNQIQDNLYLEQYKPSLKPIVEPVNYSNEYLASQNNLINQLYQNANQGEQQMSMNNPYDLGGLRPYAQIDNPQFAPVPNQPQGIDYQMMLQQFNEAMDKDARQNQVNTLVNAFGALGTPTRKAPIYYVGANGDLRAIEQDQAGQVQPLPTNISSNADKFLGQLKIQQAQQAQQAAQQKQQLDVLQQQREYIDMINAAQALGNATGYDPRVFMNTDYGKAVIEQMIHPEAQASANIRETIGKAPTQATLKAAEQRGETAGKLDEIQLGKQFDAMIANINNNAKMEEQAMIQSGMDRRTAAQLANQSAINQYTQLMNNFRTNAELNNALQLQQMRGQNALSVADIYANRQGGSDKPALTIGQQVYMEAVKSGMPVPQAIKYAQVVDPNFGATEAEINELNR